MKKLHLPLKSISFRTGQLGTNGPLTAEISFYDFLHDNVLTGFGRKLKDVQRALSVGKKVLAALEGKKNYVYLDSTLVDEMQTVCETIDWNPLLALQLEPFFEAIANAKAAKDEEPLGLVPAETEVVGKKVDG